MHAPADAARALGIAPATLRKWSAEFAAHLGPEAASGGATGRRRYSDSDIARLRQASALLRQGATYEEARQQLAQVPVEPSTGDSNQAEAFRPDDQAVTVIEPSDQAAALAQLVEAQRQIIADQRQHVADQQALINQLQYDAEQLRTTAEQERDRSKQAIVDALMALERARADEARALASLQTMLRKIPRWLRGLLGLGA